MPVCLTIVCPGDTVRTVHNRDFLSLAYRSLYKYLKYFLQILEICAFPELFPFSYFSLVCSMSITKVK